MIWITDQLGLGPHDSINDYFRLADWVVNVAQEVSYKPPICPVGKGAIKYGGVVDGAPILPLVRIISTLLEMRKKVIVHCVHGVNRSPAAVICVLMECGMAEAEARRLVMKKLPDSRPTESIVSSYKAEISGADR